VKLPIWLVIPLVIIFIVFNIFTGGGDDSVPISEPVFQDEISEVGIPTILPAEIVLPPADNEGQTWLVMLYQDADDKILERYLF
jgi:hypothetical protein